MIEIHLYGNLRRYAGTYRAMEDTVLRHKAREGETLQSVLDKAGIPPREISHVFINARLLATRAPLAEYYDFPQQRATVSDWDLSVPLGDGDRIGLFGTDLPMLSM